MKYGFEWIDGLVKKMFEVDGHFVRVHHENMSV